MNVTWVDGKMSRRKGKWGNVMSIIPNQLSSSMAWNENEKDADGMNKETKTALHLPVWFWLGLGRNYSMLYVRL